MQWFENDKYVVEDPIPAQFSTYAGPNGVATVKAFEDGKTSKGWGAEKFMKNYEALKFNDQIAKVGWISSRWNFAFVMRSLDLVCIDIDGKNGGVEHVGKLGMLPPTLAETSKSGDGYHLFYSTGDTWDDEKGFAKFRDRIGTVQGVDIRSVGCVYHFPGQKWNSRPIAPLPAFLDNLWTADELSGAVQVQELTALLTEGSEDELLVVKTQLLKDLQRPIPAGRRNITLYAIGVKMKMLDITGWQMLLVNRGLAVGLDSVEMDKLIANVERYG